MGFPPVPVPRTARQHRLRGAPRLQLPPWGRPRPSPLRPLPALQTRPRPLAEHCGSGFLGTARGNVPAAQLSAECREGRSDPTAFAVSLLPSPRGRRGPGAARVPAALRGARVRGAGALPLPRRRPVRPRPQPARGPRAPDPAFVTGSSEIPGKARRVREARARAPSRGGGHSRAGVSPLHWAAGLSGAVPGGAGGRRWGRGRGPGEAGWGSLPALSPDGASLGAALATEPGKPGPWRTSAALAVPWVLHLSPPHPTLRVGQPGSLSGLNFFGLGTAQQKGSPVVKAACCSERRVS